MDFSIIISSSGLKNIALSRFKDEDDFILIFGDQEIRMKSFFAEFISPVISRLHQSDPTIQQINFSDLFSEQKDYFAKSAKDIMTPDIISLLQQISSGYSISINNDQAFKMRFLSIILGNEELFSKLNEFFPPDLTEENVNTYLKYIECCYNFSQFSPDFDFSSIINYISNNFYSIDENQFL